MAVLRKFVILIGLILAAMAAPIAAEGGKRVALTFDDAPREAGAFLTEEERTERLIAGLEQAGVEQAAFFVTTGNIDRTTGGAERIARYAAAGHVLANHTHSHRHLSQTSVEAFLSDIDRAGAWLASYPQNRPWVRFPFLDEGRGDREKRDAVRAGLAERGLGNGIVTIDASDWRYDDLARQAAAAGLALDMDALGELWVESHVQAAEFYDQLARRALGRSPAHLMLLHETDLSALYIADLVAALKASGWTIMTADAAMADPLTKMLPDVPSAQGTMVEMIAWEQGFPAPRWYARNAQAPAVREFQARVLGEVPQ